MTEEGLDDLDRLTIRPADRGDLDALGSFRCSNGPWYEDEIEKYIQDDVPKLVENRSQEYQLLVTTDKSDELLALAGYRLDPLRTSDGTISFLNRLDVVALAVGQQGRELNDGSKLSDALLAALFSQALKVNGVDVFFAIVARENQGCISFLERNADWTQLPHGGIKYLRMTARIEVATSLS